MFPPVAIGQARLVSADLRLAGGFCLPAGAAALVPHHAMHSASFNWDKPNDFLPGFSLCNRVCCCLLVVPSYRVVSGTAPCLTGSIGNLLTRLPNVLLGCVSPCMQFLFQKIALLKTHQLLMHWLPSLCMLDTKPLAQGAEWRFWPCRALAGARCRVRGVQKAADGRWRQMC